MREELGSRNVSNKTVDMHSPSKISLYLHQKTILSCGLYLVRKLRSNPFQCTLFRLETISLCGDIHQILHKWETCQQFCKSLYLLPLLLKPIPQLMNTTGRFFILSKFLFDMIPQM